MIFRLKILFLPLAQMVLLPLGVSCFRNLGPSRTAFLWSVLLWSCTTALFFSIALELRVAAMGKATLAAAGGGLLLALAVSLFYIFFIRTPLPGLLGELIAGTSPASLTFGFLSALLIFASLLRRGRRRRMFH